VSDSQDTVLDPSFGGGVFLHAAQQRLLELGGQTSQVLGIELDDDAFASSACFSSGKAGPQLRKADFFQVDPSVFGLVSAVVGNPPYIRYQRFVGSARDRAIRCAAEAGVHLPKLSSSWAPFLVHATRFVAVGGRLGMVVPAEIGYASYARPVIDYLRRSFRSLRLIAFRRRLFRQLSEDTLLLLADGRGMPFERLEFLEVPDVEALEGELPDGHPINPSSSREMPRLATYLLEPMVRGLYASLTRIGSVKPLASVATIGIGYVSGDNQFFHLDSQTVRKFGIPESALHPTVPSISEFNGVEFTVEDWEEEHAAGGGNLLLRGELTSVDAIARYLEEGTRRGVPERYKCRARDPWYIVPHVHIGDAFVSCMSGRRPKLVLNRAGAAAPNTLHVARLRQETGESPEAVASTWRTSLTGLSCEIEGHALGGGLLKLEPKEVRRVLLAIPPKGESDYRELAYEIDVLERAGELEAARALADDEILRKGLGLSQGEIAALQTAWRDLHDRRLTR
jgi:hypothetical protein